MLEKGIFVPNLEMHPFNQTIRNVVQLLQRQAELQKTKIVFNPLQKEVIAQIDLMRTQQIVINLLTNALKFSKEGDVVRVDALMETISEDNVKLSFKVIDSGIGISEQDLSDLFKPFFRSKDKLSLQTNKNGSGLGLHICQNILKQLDGKISVSSQLGKGSAFTVTFRTVKSDKKFEEKPRSVSLL